MILPITSKIRWFFDTLLWKSSFFQIALLLFVSIVSTKCDTVFNRHTFSYVKTSKSDKERYLQLSARRIKPQYLLALLNPMFSFLSHFFKKQSSYCVWRKVYFMKYLRNSKRLQVKFLINLLDLLGIDFLSNIKLGEFKHLSVYRHFLLPDVFTGKPALAPIL